MNEKTDQNIIPIQVQLPSYLVHCGVMDV